jgi:hypothetical protein
VSAIFGGELGGQRKAGDAQRIYFGYFLASEIQVSQN